MMAACMLTQNTIHKPRVELQSQELQHHISQQSRCLLKNSLQKLYHHFCEEQALLNLEGRNSYRRTAICFNHLFFHPRVESMVTVIHKNQKQCRLLLKPISNCSKDTKLPWANCPVSCTSLGYSQSQPKLTYRNQWELLLDTARWQKMEGQDNLARNETSDIHFGSIIQHFLPPLTN